MLEYDLLEFIKNYGTFEVKVKSFADGYEPSDDVTVSFSFLGAVIVLDGGDKVNVVKNISGITAFEVVLDGESASTIDYDGTEDWHLDLSTYSEISKGVHTLALKATGEGIAENLSNAVRFCTSDCIFGVSGLDGQESLSLTRTDDSVSLSAIVNADGTVTSDFDGMFPWSLTELVTDELGNEFVGFPEMYFRVGVSKKRHITDIAVSSASHDEGIWYRVAPFYYGRYGGYASDNKLCSKRGVTRTTSLTRAGFRTYAANNGDGYSQLDLYHKTVLLFLWLIEFANKDSDGIMTGRVSGSGTSGGTSIRPCGGTDDILTPSGYEPNYKQMRYHYIEDFLGNTLEFIDGIVGNSTNAADYITADPSLFSDSEANMEQLAYLNPAAVPSYPVISAFGWDSDKPFMVQPIALVNDSAYNTYFADRATDYSSSYVTLYSGKAYNTNSAYQGISYFGRRAASSAYTDVGARLIKQN